MAEKMMRMAARREDGTATAVKANTDGSISTVSNTECLQFNKDNIGLNVIKEDFTKRTKGQVEIRLSHVNKINFSTDGGVFDQILTIEHTFDKPVKVTMHAAANNGTDTGLWLYQIFSETMPAANGFYRLTLTPEKSQKITDGIVSAEDKRAVIEVPELRQPISHFVILLDFDEAPTTGELKVFVSRRY